MRTISAGVTSLRRAKRSNLAFNSADIRMRVIDPTVIMRYKVVHRKIAVKIYYKIISGPKTGASRLKNDFD